MGLERIALPSVPAGKFALGSDIEIGAVQERVFGDIVHGQSL
jgi:hypothetical protein